MSGSKSERRMAAYYYSFEPTGVEAIDVLLSAVACAGKAFHHTNDWGDDSGTYNPEHRGANPVEWMQNAANDAAEAMQQLADCSAAIAQAREEGRREGADQERRAMLEKFERLASRLHEMAQKSFREGEEHPPGSTDRLVANARGWEQNAAGNAIVLCLDPNATYPAKP